MPDLPIEWYAHTGPQTSKQAIGDASCELLPSKMQRQSIFLRKKKENIYFGAKQTTVAGPNFSITQHYAQMADGGRIYGYIHYAHLWFFFCYGTRFERLPSKMQRLIIIWVGKKETSHLGTKQTTVAGPDFYITPKWRPRCQICPLHGTCIEARRPQSKQLEMLDVSFCHQKCKGRAYF